MRIARARYPGNRGIGALLSPVCSGNERMGWRAGKNDIAGFISYQQRARHVRNAAQAHDAHAIGKVVHDPHFAVASGGNRHWVHADRNTSLERKSRGRDVEDFKCAVGSIGGK